ncbi:hypothetical protein CDAR_214291 [Caerostris darwini]|uniref:Uncharacterized protein n=1 Tax=Caerostris darwini TaxID=1538125 RepID=A0AAV4S6R3_9ARAC|nr:hypothetical protein CDAR_214291 [Caerostris darwini]
MVVSNDSNSGTYKSPKKEASDPVKDHAVQPVWITKRNNMIRKPEPTSASVFKKRNIHYKTHFTWTCEINGPSLSQTKFQHSHSKMLCVVIVAAVEDVFVSVHTKVFCLFWGHNFQLSYTLHFLWRSERIASL